MLGVSAAPVTGGASAAMSMAVGAWMTGGDGRLMEQLRDASGMWDKVLIRLVPRYKYARSARLPAARSREVGSDLGTTLDFALAEGRR
ncbi:MAG TPA: hypothetical protein VMV23_02250 [Candidatus Nanopelagicaceae bacterium]|nr:hypothetical protein [Candidatus Nanopelagicaceae bacterium]